MTDHGIRRILYIEDDPHIQEIAKIALENLGGFMVELASSGPEGLDIARRWRPDLILLDAMMPVMDGKATYLALRAQSETRTTPIIFLTAKVQPQEVQGYLGLGAEGVIPKPFDPMTLAEEVKAIEGKSHEHLHISPQTTSRAQGAADP